MLLDHCFVPLLWRLMVCDCESDGQRPPPALAHAKAAHPRAGGRR